MMMLQEGNTNLLTCAVDQSSIVQMAETDNSVVSNTNYMYSKWNYC